MKKGIIELAHNRLSNIESFYFVLSIFGLGMFFSHFLNIDSKIIGLSYLMVGTFLMIVKRFTKPIK